MGVFKNIARKLKNAFNVVRTHSTDLLKRRKSYVIVRVEDLPETPRDGKLYVAGEAGYEWAAGIVCPCGCGDVIRLNLLPEARPRWTFYERDGKAGLEPSVWRRQGCRSHFFLRHGEVQWCESKPVPRKPKRRSLFW